jgi:hypothetical protein
MGFLIGDNTRRISVHHCLFAHNYQRNPRLKHGVEADLVNNVIYNWDDGAAHLLGDFARQPDAPPVRANIVGNTYLPGADTRDIVPVLQPLTAAVLYLDDNVTDQGLFTPGQAGIPSLVTLRDAPVPFPEVTRLPSARARDAVLARAGADRPARDDVDRRIVEEVRNGAGRHISRPADVGGWPPLRRGEPRRDSDNDGIPDDWEKGHGLDPRSAFDANRTGNEGGYTNLEIWLKELAGQPARLPSADSSSRPSTGHQDPALPSE